MAEDPPAFKNPSINKQKFKNMTNLSKLVLTNDHGDNVTTSLIVAEVFSKEHKNVLQEIRNLNCSDEFHRLNFKPIKYTDSKGREQIAHEITKDGFSFLVMGYTGEKAGEFKEKFIVEFNKRDSLLKNDDYILGRALTILSERNKALEQTLEQNEQRLALQENVIKHQAPKVEYYNEVLDSTGLISTTIIAKDLGMSAESLNKKLNQMGVIFKQNGTWVPYSRFQDKGFCKSKTFPYTDQNGKQQTSIRFYWTEAGRQYIFKVLRPEPVKSENL